MHPGWWLVLAIGGCGFHGPVTSAIGDAPAADSVDPDAPAGALIPILYIQGTGSDISNDTLTVAYAAAQIAHDLNLVVVSWTDTSASVATLSDSNHNTYAPVGGVVSTSGFAQEVFCAPDIKVGANMVTAALTNSTDLVLRIVEYAGLSITAPVDLATSMTGQSATADGGTLAIHHAHELLFAANTVAGTVIGHPAEYTQRLVVMGNSIEDREVTAISSYDATATQDNNGDFVMTVVGLIGAR